MTTVTGNIKHKMATNTNISDIIEKFKDHSDKAFDDRANTLLDEFCEHPYANEEKCCQLYDNWAKKYDDDMRDMKYVNAQHASDLVTEMYAKHLADKVPKDKVRILDAACGTGTGGVQLYEAGFREIYGLDGSSGMIELCKQKTTRGTNPQPIYKQCYQVLVKKDSKLLDNVEDLFDIFYSAGSFYPMHFTDIHVRPLFATVKSGGLLVVSCSPKKEQDPAVATVIEELIKEGQVERLVEDITVDSWYGEHTGTTFILKKL